MKLGQGCEFQSQTQTWTSEKVKDFELRFQLVTWNRELKYLIV